MLAISGVAADAMTRIVAAHDGTNAGAGIRITHEATGAERYDLAMEVRPGPEAGDQVVAEEGARVFMPPETAELLDDKLLEAQVRDGDLAGFEILEQG
jgi:Fe-S cluster assembly iron-binding protein IscA